MTALIRTVKPWQGVYIYLFIPPHSSLQLLLQWFFLVHFCLALVPCGFRFWVFFSSSLFCAAPCAEKSLTCCSVLTHPGWTGRNKVLKKREKVVKLHGCGTKTSRLTSCISNLGSAVIYLLIYVLIFKPEPAPPSSQLTKNCDFPFPNPVNKKEDMVSALSVLSHINFKTIFKEKNQEGDAGLCVKEWWV